MRKRIFRLLVEVEHLNRAVSPHRMEQTPILYEVFQPIPPLPGDPSDGLTCVLIEYDEQPDEDGDLVGAYTVYGVPPEGTDLHSNGIGISITHSTNEVRRVYDSFALPDLKTKLEELDKAGTEEEQGEDDDTAASQAETNAGSTVAGSANGAGQSTG